MKKFYQSLLILTVLTIVGGLCAYAAEITKFSSKFVKHFKDCERYEETVNSEFEGKQFTTHRNIIGWKNGMCRYQETIASPTDKYRLNCRFTTVQVDDLYKAMIAKGKDIEKYELDVYGEQTDPKTNKKEYKILSTTTISGNKAYIAWAKVQNNPYFCMPEKLSK